jgi:5-methyltetrahydropteroyltriglutamate--homocysteine methyltransferase
VNVFASATGIGSWPGAAARPAAEVVVGELGAAMAHLVELPARGVGADIIGRAGAFLIDIALDTVPRGYRLAARPGAVMRRAASLLAEDIDALEEAWEVAGLRGSGRPVKVQAPGPITLAAELELSNGHRAISDLGAFTDIAASLAEGVAAHRASVSRRLDTPVVVQFDEPSLPAAVAGRLTGVTALSPVAAIEETLATTMLDVCVVAAGAEVSVHSCVSSMPWNVLQHSNISSVSVDAGTLQAADLDAVAEFVESGRVVMLGVVPASAPGSPRRAGWPRRPRSGPAPPSAWLGALRRLSPMIRTPSETRQPADAVSVARCPHPTYKRCWMTMRCASSCTLTAAR